MWPSNLFDSSPSHLGKRIQGNRTQRENIKLLFRDNLTDNLTSKKNHNDQVTISEQWKNEDLRTTLPN